MLPLNKEIEMKLLLFILSLNSFAAGIIIDQKELDIKIEHAKIAFKCSPGPANSYVYTSARLNPFFVPEDISNNFRRNDNGFYISRYPGEPCEPIESQIKDLITSENTINAKATRKVGLTAVINTDSGAACQLYLTERVAIEVGELVFSNFQMTYIKDLPGLNWMKCRTHIPSGF